MLSPTAIENSLESLARDHAAAVYRYLRSLTGDAELARDLVQETFLRLARHADDAGPGLVFTIARSCALDHQRRRSVRHRFETATTDERRDAAPDRPERRPDCKFDGKQFHRDLHSALQRLPEEQRTVFHLSEIEGRSYAEIADVLGAHPGTIASRKHHAVRKLREHLRRLGYEA